MPEFQPPSYLEIKAALDQTKNWVDNWHQQFRQAHNLTDEALRGDKVELSSIGGGGRLVVERGFTSYLWRVTHDFESSFGTTSILHLERLDSVVANHPKVVILVYKINRFNSVDIVTFGWDKNYFGILSERLEKPYGRVDRLSVVTSLPDNEQPQRLNHSFIYEYPNLDQWSAELTSVNTSDGQIKLEQLRCHSEIGRPLAGYSPDLNPIPNLESFGRHQWRAKLPLISTE